MSTVAKEDVRAKGTGADEICYLSVEEATRRFRERTLSPVDLMRAVIDRCEAVNPKVNAITNRFYEKAMAQAAEAEKRYAQGNARPLDGVPLAAKELHPIEGMRTSWGSKIYENTPADYTLPAIQRLLDAGAIVHIRTTTPEFAHAGHCHSPLYGVTRNPWNPEFSSCGSSGGSAVAVATGMATFATGDDGGGSIRMPASANGLVGYKPPFGRNPACLLETYFEQILHVGVITRTVRDSALSLNVTNGQHPMDIMSLPGKIEIPAKLPDPKGMRVAYSPNLGYFEVDREVAENTAAAVKRLEAMGCKVDTIDLDWNDEAYDAWVTHWEGLFAAIAEQHMTRWQYKMDPFVRGLIQRGQNHDAVRVKQTELARTRMWKVLAKVFADHDVLVCPTLAVPAIGAEHANDDRNFRINGAPVDAYLQWALTYPFNILSQCPAMSVPSGFAASGVPTGMQVVGRPYDDVSVFRIASAFEAAAPWAGRHPAV